MRSRWTVMVVGLVISTFSSVAWAQRGYDPADQRPDLLPHPIYNAWVPYRAEYNRPRFVGGYLAYKMEPTSQEAMSWKENYCNGMYGTIVLLRSPTTIIPSPGKHSTSDLERTPRRSPRSARAVVWTDLHCNKTCKVSSYCCLSQAIAHRQDAMPRRQDAYATGSLCRSCLALHRLARNNIDDCSNHKRRDTSPELNLHLRVGRCQQDDAHHDKQSGAQVFVNTDRLGRLDLVR